MALTEILNELDRINAYLTHNKNPTLSPADFWVLSRFSLISNHAKIPHKALLDDMLKAIAHSNT